SAQMARSEGRRLRLETREPTLSTADHDLAIAVDQALRHLKEPERNAVLLRDVLSLSHEEVGQRLNCSADAARVRVERAHQKLRKALGSSQALTILARLATDTPSMDLTRNIPTLSAPSMNIPVMLKVLIPVVACVTAYVGIGANSPGKLPTAPAAVIRKA